MRIFFCLGLAVFTATAELCDDGDWSASGQKPCTACPDGFRSRPDRKHCYPFTCSHVFCRHETHTCNTQQSYVAGGGLPHSLCDGRTHQSVRVYYTGAEEQCRGGHSCKMHGPFCRCSPTARLPDYPHIRYSKCSDAPLKTEKLPHGTIAVPLRPHWNIPKEHSGDGLRYICDPGYKFAGDREVRDCNRDGTWGPAPICVVDRYANSLGDDAPNVSEDARTDCVCANGKPATGHFCTSKGANVCSSCDEGFHLQDFRCTATTATCTCANGVAAADALCPGGEFCTVCDAGFHLFNRECKAYNTARYDLATTPALKYDTGFNGHKSV